MTDVATAILTQEMLINPIKKEFWVNIYYDPKNGYDFGINHRNRANADAVADDTRIYCIHVRLK